MHQDAYSSNVFLNFPFDEAYSDMQKALIFAIFDCGFYPRCALEEDNSGNVRFEKIQRLIAESRLGIHDISRTEIDAKTGLPRFNMPLELGVFIGAKQFGSEEQQRKNCLILDRDNYRYQAFISDIAGHDIRCHEANPDKLIVIVRNWLNSASLRTTILPGGTTMVRRYHAFREELPEFCTQLSVEVSELTYRDYCSLVSTWLTKAPAAVI